MLAHGCTNALATPHVITREPRGAHGDASLAFHPRTPVVRRDPASRSVVASQCAHDRAARRVCGVRDLGGALVRALYLRSLSGARLLRGAAGHLSRRVAPSQTILVAG